MKFHDDPITIFNFEWHLKVWIFFFAYDPVHLATLRYVMATLFHLLMIIVIKSLLLRISLINSFLITEENIRLTFISIHILI